MPPPRGTICSNCNSRKWKRVDESIWVCQRGHQYQGLEQVGDNEAQIGIASRAIRLNSHQKKIRKRKEVRKKIKLDSHLYLLYFQFRISQQAAWLVENAASAEINQGIPLEKLPRFVLDLWCLWISQMTTSTNSTTPSAQYTEEVNEANCDSGSVTEQSESFVHTPASSEIDQPNDDYTLPQFYKDPLVVVCSVLRPCYSLVFLYIALFALKSPITLGDLVRYSTGSKFPYFSNEKHKYSFSSGGYPAIPPVSTLQELVVSVTSVLYQGGFVLEITLSQPHLVLRFFKELELPVELYLYYKTISSLYGCRQINNPHMYLVNVHVSTCCLWIARLYHATHSPALYPIQTPASFLFNPEKVISDFYLPFTTNGISIMPQKKNQISKVALSLFKETATIPQPSIHENGINLAVRNEFQEKVMQMHLQEKEDSKSLDQFPHITTAKIWRGIDYSGARDALYEYLLCKIANVLGMERSRIDREMEKLDEFLKAFSESL